MRTRTYSEYTADLKEDSCERQLRGDLRFQIVESIRLDGTHYWEILDLETNLSECKSCVLSIHKTQESAEFTAEILNSWQNERARLILASDPIA